MVPNLEEKGDHTGPNGKGRPCYQGAISIRLFRPKLHPTGQLLHKGVRKSDFGSVDGAITSCFDEGEVIGILGIEDDVIDGLLFHVNKG